MTKKIFTKEKWMETLKGLKENYKLLVPFKDGDFHNFKSLDEVVKADFDYENTRLSPKGLIYPQSERMFECSIDSDAVDAHIYEESPKDYSPQAIVGIRPCDAQAFQIVKLNFSNPEFNDPWWLQHYESTVLVGLGCNNPCPSCFCTSVGGGPFHKKHLDVLLYDLGEHYLAEAVTEKGEAFLEKAEGGNPAEESFTEAAGKLAGEAESKITSAPPTDKLKDKDVLGLFDASFWDNVAFACINCGTCTYLCPTCWCFDIQDEVYEKTADRLRNWDSCMFPLFTLHGSGHNPRDEKVQRVRQRFMHKLKYYVDKYENGIQCSGCGRCVRFCPVNIDIRQVCEEMNSYE
ncbi:4Fe-4S dicluster domain-containing protein [Thermodesulfobacteriota bacterium]